LARPLTSAVKWKVKAKTTLDMIAIGFTGPAAAPTSLVLAFPGHFGDQASTPCGPGCRPAYETPINANAQRNHCQARRRPPPAENPCPGTLVT
jgi:hypothetical protein